MQKQIFDYFSTAVNYYPVKKLRQIDFVRFCVVGGIGLIVNFLSLYFLHGLLGLTILFAQLLGAELAIISNFFLHSNWTYKKYREEKLWIRFVKFHATMLIGYLINTVTVVLLVSQYKIFYGLALVAGSIMALMVNFGTTRYYVWAHTHLPPSSSSDDL